MKQYKSVAVIRLIESEYIVSKEANFKHASFILAAEMIPAPFHGLLFSAVTAELLSYVIFIISLRADLVQILYG